MTLTTSITTGAAALDQRDAILAHLREFNAAAAGPANAEPLCFAILGDDEQIRGGLFATTAYAWLIVELLFVPADLRGTGAGTRLIAQAEQFAQERACVGVWLDTFSFQARSFYEKLGYTVAGSIPDHPVGGARYFMMKRLE